MALCACGREESNPYGIRAGGQWHEVCQLCATEYTDNRRVNAFDGSGFTFRPPHDARTAQAPCAWCGGTDGIVGEIVNGGCWWICRSCYQLNTGEEPWSPSAVREEFFSHFAELLATYRALLGELPAVPHHECDEQLTRDPTLSFADWPLVRPVRGTEALWSSYGPAPAPRRGSPMEFYSPGFRLGVCPNRYMLEQASAAWFITHDGLWHVTSSDGRGEPIPLLQQWLSEVDDPVTSLVGREAAWLLTLWDPRGAGTPTNARMTREDMWGLRVTLARLTAVTYDRDDRARALDALCGLGWHGDYRPELVPSPAELPAARWPLHPPMDDEARREIRSRFPR